MADYPTVALYLAPLGFQCRLLLDGVDVSHLVRGVEVRADVGHVTEVIVTMLARVEITGEAGRVLVNFPKETPDGET